MSLSKEENGKFNSEKIDIESMKSKTKKISDSNLKEKEDFLGNKIQNENKFLNKTNNNKNANKNEENMLLDLVEDENDMKKLNPLNQIFNFDARKNSKELAYQRLLRRPSFRKNLSKVIKIEKNKEEQKEKIKKEKSLKQQTSFVSTDNNNNNPIVGRKTSIFEEENFLTNNFRNEIKEGFIAGILKRVKMEEKDFYGNEVISKANNYIFDKNESLTKTFAHTSDASTRTITEANFMSPNRIFCPSLSNDNLIQEGEKEFIMNSKLKTQSSPMKNKIQSISGSKSFAEDEKKFDNLEENTKQKQRKLLMLKNTCESISENGLESDIGNYKYLIDSKSTWKKTWDLIISCIIVYSVFVDPIRLTFSELDYSFYLYIDTLFDIMFITDIAFNFFVPIYEKGILIKSFKKITLNYLARWFFFDLISSIPFSLIIIIVNYSASNSSFVNLKNILRISRIYRMIKWATIFRLLKFAKQRSNKNISDPDLEEDNAIMRIIKFIFLFVILLHISSCMWIYIGIPTEGQQFTWIYFNSLADAGPLDTYVASLYFNLVTLYTIGYGDIRPYTFSERFYNCIFMSVAIVLYSFGLTALSTFFSRYNLLKVKLKEKLDYAKDLYSRYKMSQDLYRKIKLAIRHNLGKVVVEKFDLLESLPDSLKKEVFMCMFKAGLSEHKFFANQEKEFIFYVLPLLKSQMLHKTEIVISYGDFIEEMYIVGKGMLSISLEKKYANIQISLIKKNQHFGDILMYLNENCPYVIACFTMQCELLSINKTDFSQIKLAFNTNMLEILKNSCDYFHNLEKTKKVVEKLYNIGIATHEIKFKLKKLNNILMERTFNELFEKDVFPEEAEDFILMHKEKKIVELLSTPMTEQDFLRIFFKEYLHAQSLGSQSKSLNAPRNGTLLQEINENSDSEESFANMVIDHKNQRRRFTEKIVDNMNLGNFSNQLSTFLNKEGNINANMAICKSVKGRFSQICNLENNVGRKGSASVHEEKIASINKTINDNNRSKNNNKNNNTSNQNYKKSKQGSNPGKNKSPSKNENSDQNLFVNEKVDNNINNNLDFSLNGNDVIVEQDNNYLIGNEKFRKSVGHNKDKIRIKEMLPKNKSKKTRKSLKVQFTEEKEKEKEDLEQPPNLTLKNLSLTREDLLRELRKGDSNKSVQTVKIKNNRNTIISYQASNESKLNTNIHLNKLSTDKNRYSNFINDNNNISFKNKTITDRENIINLISDDKNDKINSDISIISISSIGFKDKNKRKLGREKMRASSIDNNKKSNYNILQIYNYGNNIKNEYIISNNSKRDSSRSADDKENSTKKRKEISSEKESNRQKIIIKEATRFTENKLVCFKIHEIQFTNNNLSINQIDQKIENNNKIVDNEINENNINDLNDNINFKFNQSHQSYTNIYSENDKTRKLSEGPNFLKFDTKISATAKLRLSAENNEIGINDKSRDSSNYANESINMSNLNLFTDENFLAAISKNNTKENLNLQEILIKTEDSNQHFALKKSGRDLIEKIKVGSIKNINNNNKTNNLNYMKNNINNNNNNNNNRVSISTTQDKNENENQLKINFSNTEKELLVNNSKNILKKNIPFVSKYDSITDSKLFSNKNVNTYKDNPVQFSPILIAKETLENNKHAIDDLVQIIQFKPLKKEEEEKELHKENKNKSSLIHNSIKEERAMLKLDYIYSILKVIDKYQE